MPFYAKYKYKYTKLKQEDEEEEEGRKEWEKKKSCEEMAKVIKGANDDWLKFVEEMNKKEEKEEELQENLIRKKGEWIAFNTEEEKEEEERIIEQEFECFIKERIQKAKENEETKINKKKLPLKKRISLSLKKK